MISNDNDTQSINETINLYFKGTYFGEADQIRQAFHSKAHITGCINGETHDWPLNDFITRVTAKPTAADKNEKYQKEIIYIDKTNDAAIVKAQVFVSNLFFTDYIMLLKINNKWLIRNKSFTTSGVDR